MVNAAFQLGLALVALLRGIAVAGFVTASDYGIWGLLGLALWTAMAARAVGVNDKYVQQAEADQRTAFQRAFTVELLFAAIGTCALLVLVPGFAALTGHEELILPGLVLAVVIPAGALQFPIWSYYRRMDFGRLRALQAAEPLVATVVTLALAIAGAGYWSFVAGVAAGAWAGALVAIRHSLHPLAVRWHGPTLRSYVTFSAPVAVAGLSTLAVFEVIYLAGNEWLGLAGLGAFTLAGNVLAFAHRADAVVTDALYPALCAVRDRREVLFEAFMKSNRLALLWAVPFGVGLSLFAADLVGFVLGARWAEAVGLLQAMGVLAAVHHVGFNWHAFYRAQGRTQPIAVAAVLGGIVFVAAALPLMRAHGLAGLAAAFLITEAAMLVIRGRFLRRLFPGFRMMGYLVRALLPAAGAAALVLLVRAVDAGERGPLTAGAELGLFVLIAAGLGVALERSLLREAVGYAFPRAARHA